MPSFFSPVVADSRIGINVSFSAWESSTNAANNTSTVSWSVTVGHGATFGFTGTTRAQGAYLYLNVGGHQVLNGAWLSLTKGRYPGDGVYSNSGSVTIQHNSDGTKKIDYSCSISQGAGNYQNDPWTYASKSGGTHGLTLTNLRSNATGPSNLTIEGGLGEYIQPGGTLTLKWTLGKDGNYNPINNYHLLVDNQTVINNISKTSSSVTFKIPGDWVRGRAYSFKVRASATHNSADSNTVSKKINVLPAAPIIKLNGTTNVTNQNIGNYTSNQKITLTPGQITNSAFNGGTGKVYRIETSDTLVTADTLDYTKYKLYSYRTWDGLEYGPTAYVQMNPKPTFVNNIVPQWPGNETYQGYTKAAYFTSTFDFRHDNLTKLQNTKITSFVEFSTTAGGSYAKSRDVTVEFPSNLSSSPKTPGTVITPEADGFYWRVRSKVTTTSNGVNLTNEHVSQILYYPKVVVPSQLEITSDTGEPQYVLNNFSNIKITPKVSVVGDTTPFPKVTAAEISVEYTDIEGKQRTLIPKRWPITGNIPVLSTPIDISKADPLIPFGSEVKVSAYYETADYRKTLASKNFIRVKKPIWGSDVGGSAGIRNLHTDESLKRYSNYYTTPYLKADSMAIMFPRIVNTQWNTANEKLTYFVYFYLGDSKEKTLLTKVEQTADAGGTNNVSTNILATAWKDFLVKHPKIGDGSATKALKENLPFKITVVGRNSKSDTIYIDSDELVLSERNDYIKILEPPYFKDGTKDNLYIAGRHSYNKDMKAANQGVLPLEVDTPNNYYFKLLETDTEEIMVNPNEHIVLKFRPALDYNGNDISYRVLFNGIPVIEKATITQSNGYNYIFIPYDNLLIEKPGVITNSANIVSIVAYDNTNVLGPKSTIILQNNIYLTPTGTPTFYYSSAVEVLNGVGPEGEPVKAGAKINKMNVTYWGGSSDPVNLGNLYRKSLKCQTGTGTTTYNPINTLTYTIKNKKTGAVELTKTITLNDDFRAETGEYVIYLDPKGIKNDEEKIIDFKIKLSTGFGTEANNLTYVEGAFDNFMYIPRKPLLVPRYQQLGVNSVAGNDETMTVRCLADKERPYVTYRRADDIVTIKLDIVNGVLTLLDGGQLENAILKDCSIDGGTY